MASRGKAKLESLRAKFRAVCKELEDARDKSKRQDLTRRRRQLLNDISLEAAAMRQRELDERIKHERAAS